MCRLVVPWRDHSDTTTLDGELGPTSQNPSCNFLRSELRPGKPEGLKQECAAASEHTPAATPDQQIHNMAIPVTSSAALHSTTTEGHSISMSAAELNPPEVQRYVVEHIVKSEDATIRSSRKLRMFSGRLPHPQHEVDYDTWRSGVDLILKDPAISELRRSRHILDSLLPPAADIIKHLNPDLPAATYIQYLDSAYGIVQDGEELYVKFMDTLQDSGEKPSGYVQRLQVALSLAVKRGGVKQGEVNRHLLSQFCRGCWDSNLISELQLKQRKSNPPSFAELLLLLRTEEDREASKTLRMKQHLGTSRHRVAAQAQFAVEEGKGVCAALSTLTQQMAEIQKQLAALTASQSHQLCTPVPKQHQKQRTDTQGNISPNPKPGFCFRCGEDGHIRPQLEGAAGQTIPYLGYIEISVKFPRDFVGKEYEVTTLALVVPDPHPDVPAIVLIGMNTLEPLYEQYLNQHPSYQPSTHGYRAVLKTLQLSHEQKENGNIGIVRLLSKAPVRVPAGRTIVIQGSAKVSTPLFSQSVLLQHPASTLPGGLCVSSCLINFPALSPYKVPVVITNESEQDTFIPPHSVIADLETYHCILSEHRVTHLPVRNTITSLDFDFEEIVKAICQSHLVRATRLGDCGEVGLTLVESLSVKVDTISDSYCSEDLYQLPVVPTLNIKEKQHADPCIRELIHQLETGERIPPTARAELPELPFLLREWSRLELVDGVLYRRRRDHEDLLYQLVLPEELRPSVLKSLHEDMGHMGIERTLDLVRTRFYWPKMAKDVEQKIKTCGRCVRRKALPEKAAPLVSIKTSRPLELLCMDFLTLEPDASGTRDILVLTDHFTKFAVAIPTPNQKARTVAKCLWENYIIYYGIPERIHTDQGRDFESRLIKELSLEPGDRVLVRNVRLRGKHKLSDKWEEEVYVVVHRAGDLPVYKVKPENSDGPMRTLHRDLLLPCGFLTDSEVNLESSEQSLPHRPRTRQQNLDLNSFPEPLVEDEDTGSLVSLYVNPPTLHFTVEKQTHFPDSSDGGSLEPLILDPSVEVEVQGESASVSSVLPPAVDSGGEQSGSDVEDILLELVESHSENRHSLPENLPGNGDILVDIPVVAVEDSPEESSVIEQGTDIDQKTTVVKSGQDVTLTCRTPNSILITAVKWSRTDLEPEFVLLFQDSLFVTDNQHPSFKNRVDLQDRQVKDGDVSLILKDVTTADSGTYECRIFMRGTNHKDSKPISRVTLSVDPPGQTRGQEKDEDNKDGGKKLY
ncbi:unnamed protein product [Oreochromis niloticus]|nr:unnamed protein product [Mustela putorius furo]